MDVEVHPVDPSTDRFRLIGLITAADGTGSPRCSRKNHTIPCSCCSWGTWMLRYIRSIPRPTVSVSSGSSPQPMARAVHDARGKTTQFLVHAVAGAHGC